MIVHVHFHTILQQRGTGAKVREMDLSLSEGATVGEVLRLLDIPLPAEALILVINHRVANEQTILASGDKLDIIPAISGGSSKCI